MSGMDEVAAVVLGEVLIEGPVGPAPRSVGPTSTLFDVPPSGPLPAARGGVMLATQAESSASPTLRPNRNVAPAQRIRRNDEEVPLGRVQGPRYQPISRVTPIRGTK